MHHFCSTGNTASVYSDVSDLELLMFNYYRILQKTKRRRRQQRYRIHSTLFARQELGECHCLIQELSFDPERFHMYFRMNPEAFDSLLAMVEPLLVKQNTNFRKALTTGERLVTVLKVKVKLEMYTHTIA